MTLVLVSLTNVPVRTTMWFSASVRHTTPGGQVITTDPFSVPLVNGQCQVNLEPTDGSWAWKIRRAGLPYRYYAVPNAGTPVSFGTLVELNADDLTPAALPAAPWLAALNEQKARIDVLEQSGVDPGKSAFQSWLDTGHVGTEADFVASLASTVPGPPASTQITVADDDPDVIRFTFEN